MIIMTSPYFVNDGDFDMDGDDDHNDGGLDFDVKYNGYYFFSEFEPTKNGSCYFFTKDKDYAINQENVPGESANVKLCKKDHDLFETDLYLKIFEDNKILNNL